MREGVKVGIPRALLFHHYGQCWISFLKAVGAEPVLSGNTTARTIAEGSFHADNETCLPVKVFSGHLMELKDSVDYLLVPRVVRQSIGYCACPKFLGLPDMARSLDDDLPPILAPLVDLGDMRLLWAKEWYSIARFLGAGRMRSALAVANMLRSYRLEHANNRGEEESGIPIGVAGHLYNVFDDGASLGLLSRLRRMGAEPVTVEDVNPRLARRELKSIPRRIFWGFEATLAGAVLHWSRTRSVAGVVFVTSFGCGPGSIVGALLADELERSNSIPLMTITLDEHSAEAGLVTRLEAFVDMLKRNYAATSTPHILEAGIT